MSRGLYSAGQRFYKPLNKSKRCLNDLPHVLPTKPLSRIKSNLLLKNLRKTLSGKLNFYPYQSNKTHTLYGRRIKFYRLPEIKKKIRGPII
jgi:hypothetical protein